MDNQPIQRTLLTMIAVNEDWEWGLGMGAENGDWE